MITKVFSKEIAQIQNTSFKKYCIELLDQLPQYILTQPSSTGGKYHPTDEIGSDGMIRHIKRCVLFAKELSIPYELSPIDQDILLAGCIFHDVLKMGPNNIPNGIKVYTDTQHPIYIYDFITKHLPAIDQTNKDDLLLLKMIRRLSLICLYHEGRWTIDKAREIDRPKTEYSKFLCDVMHTVDFIASRRSVYDIMQKTYFDEK